MPDSSNAFGFQLALGADQVNVANHIYTPLQTLDAQFYKGSDITSAATITLPAATSGAVSTITGAAGPITAITSRTAGQRVTFIFTGAPTITHNATSLILPGARDIAVVAGMVLTFVSLGSGNWQLLSTSRAVDLRLPSQATGDVAYFNGTNWVRLAIGTASQRLSVNAGATAPEWATVAAGDLTYVEAALGADVGMPTANTFYDGPSVALTAGTWLLVGHITWQSDDGTSRSCTAKLWDGTTVEASAEESMNQGGRGQVTLAGVVVVTGTPTWKISATLSLTNGSMLAAAAINGAGNNACRLVGIKIAA